MLIYYVYTHTRLDTNEVFYVGIGRTPNSKNYFRAYTKAGRSSEWFSVLEECNFNYKVDIINTFDNHLDCCNKELYLISLYGRKHLKEGLLVNKSPGGHKWKDCIKVYQYDLNGNYIAEWISPKIASSVLNIRYDGIYASCRLFFRAGNYQFRSFKKDKIEPYVDSKLKKIYQYTLLGVYIKEYNSIKEAALSIKIKPEKLSDCAKKNRKCKNYVWSFSPDYCIVKRIISQYDLNNKLIAQYTILSEAAKALNVTSINSIDCAIKGIVQKQAYGYIWKSENNVKIINNASKKETL